MNRQTSYCCQSPPLDQGNESACVVLSTQPQLNGIDSLRPSEPAKAPLGFDKCLKATYFGWPTPLHRFTPLLDAKHWI